MIIIGAKGFAKEVLEIFAQKNEYLKEIYFFDDISDPCPAYLYDQFPILRNEKQVAELFKDIPDFVLGIGGTSIRQKLFSKFIALGGNPFTLVSPKAHIGHYNTTIDVGCTIMSGVQITNDVIIEKGTLINLNATIGHDTHIGQFCDIMPGANISGNVRIGEKCAIGTGSVILPQVTIGNNVTVGAGAVVNKDVPDNTTVVGIPAKALNR